MKRVCVHCKKNPVKERCVRLCKSCYNFLLDKLGSEKAVEERLAQYEVQRNANKKFSKRSKK